MTRWSGWVWVVPVMAVAFAGFFLFALARGDADPFDEPSLPEPARSGYADVNGIRMWYAVYNPGGGAPVLMLHGGLGSSVDWRNQIPALAEKHMVVVADSRGQGRSTRTDEPISYDLMASDVLALLDYLDLPRAAIVGWSDGGNIGLDIAIHHPERLTKLFTYGANYNVDGLIPSPTPSFLSRWKHKLESLVDERARTEREVFAMWRTEPDFQPSELAQIRVPTLVADGDLEQAVKPEHARELASLIPGAKLVMLPDAGHAGMLEEPNEFNEVLTSFLDEPDGPGAATADAVDPDPAAPLTH